VGGDLFLEGGSKKRREKEREGGRKEGSNDLFLKIGGG